jgi:glucose-6-phosphate 1-dehydrogenase
MTWVDAATSVRAAEPCCLVIFGATGDLTHRLLMPALYNLAAGDLLPDGFCIVGVGRGQLSSEALAADLAESLRAFATRPLDDALVNRLLNGVTHVQGDADNPKTYQALRQELDRIEQVRPTHGNRLFYLATPPAAFAPIGYQLGHFGLAREANGAWRRVIVEKPFGTDLESARALNQKLLAGLKEHQIYRIDHYLGKETVQNLMVFRFGNGIFEPLWNRNHIDHVQITVAETVGVETRGRFYDATGALRDMVPNHLFQLLEIVAMEPPSCFAADAVRTEKGKVLEAVHRLGDDDLLRTVVRGQYTAGTVGGKPVKAYRASANVAPDSTTETYVALKLMIDNWRWAGVPFYLRTGKALATRRSEVVIRFKQAPFALFRDTPEDRLTPKDLVMRIQPEEGVTLSFGAKRPGPKVVMGSVDMRFDYKDYFDAAPSTGYETLIYDCMNGDMTLFKRAEEIEGGWRIVQPLLDGWSAGRSDAPAAYPAGSQGPAAADELLARDGRQWRPLEPHANVR